MKTNLKATKFADGTPIRLITNGTEWDEQSNPASKDLFGVSFIDANTGYM